MEDGRVQGDLSLDEVRERFLEAESHLEAAARTVEELRSAIEAVGEARDGLRAASGEIGHLNTQIAGVISALRENLETIRHGVEALRQSDPARILQQLTVLHERTSKAHEEAAGGVAGIIRVVEDLGAGNASAHDEQIMQIKAVEARVAEGFGGTVAAVADLRKIQGDVNAALQQGLGKARWEARMWGLVAAILSLAVILLLVLRQ